MTFFVSDELKSRVSEEDFTNIYHEEKALDILVTFLISDTIFKCTLLSLTKDLKKIKDSIENKIVITHSAMFKKAP